MKVYIKGKGETTLTKNMFLAQGGEGSIYANGNTVFKIYHDPSKMIPQGKIQELSLLTDSNIVKPEDIVLSQDSKVIGYTMKYVRDNYALCQLFPKAFRERNNIDHDMMLKLIQKLQALVQHIHDKKILVVDLNEMNFLSSKSFDDIFAIDCDSYQTKTYPATAIMESIRDRHSKSFSELTDWFSFGIIAFMLFVGIHPYKGKHSKYKLLDDRMLNNISVFNKGVSIPATCYSTDIIPQAYKDWFRAVFDDGKRLVPPFDLNAVIQVINIVNKIVGSNNFHIAEIQEYEGDILNSKSNGNRIVLTTTNLFVDKHKIGGITGHAFVTSPKKNHVITAAVENGKLKLFDATSKAYLASDIVAHEVMEYDNRLYVKSNDSIVEVMLVEVGNNIIPAFKVVGNILEKASKFLDGIVIQNLLGAYYVSILPESGKCCQVRLKEIDGYKIVDGKYDRGVLMLVGAKGGMYDKFVLRFANDFSYDLRVVSDIAFAGLDFVVLDNGVVVHLTENEDIEIFSSTKGSSSMKLIDDAAITGDMTLYKNGNSIEFAKSNKLYSISMKNK